MADDPRPSCIVPVTSCGRVGVCGAPIVLRDDGRAECRLGHPHPELDAAVGAILSREPDRWEAVTLDAPVAPAATSIAVRNGDVIAALCPERAYAVFIARLLNGETSVPSGLPAPTFKMPPFDCPHCGGGILVDRLARDGSRVEVLSAEAGKPGNRRFPAWVEGMGRDQLRNSTVQFDRLVRDLRSSRVGRLALRIIGFTGGVS